MEYAEASRSSNHAIFGRPLPHVKLISWVWKQCKSEDATQAGNAGEAECAPRPLPKQERLDDDENLALIMLKNERIQKRAGLEADPKVIKGGVAPTVAREPGHAVYVCRLSRPLVA
jgi:hypothetical protein